MRICRWSHRFALSALLLLALPIAVRAPVSAAPSVAAAQTLSVDGSDPAANDTTCAPCKTIQGAINLAGPGVSIAVAPGTYHETLTITQSVSITGGVARLPGEQGPTIVDAGGAGRVVTIPNGVPSDVLVSLTSLTLIDGVAPTIDPNFEAVGGGIAALGGTVSLSDTTVMSNTATNSGGGIYASNAVTLTQSSVMSNTAGNVVTTANPVIINAATYASGGGIYGNNAVTLTGSPVISNTTTGRNGNGGGVAGNAVMLTDSPVISNSAGSGGGGIYASAALTLTNSPVIINTAGGGNGGGISGNAVMLIDSPVIINTAGGGGGIYASAALTLTDSPVIANTAGYNGGGGILAGGAVTLTDSTVSENTAVVGGGLAEMSFGFTVPNSTVLSNSAVLSNTATIGDGGGILNTGSLSLTNSTLSANSAATNGGAIASSGSVTASFSTISANSALNGGGIAMVRFAVGPPLGPTTLKATILAGNTAPSGPDTDCAGPVTSLGDNLIGDTDGCSAFSAPGDLTGSGARPLDPRLDVLADNGGPTLTQALLPGSPAINHVPAARCTNASGTPLTSDQSGVDRPDPGDLSGACDSGAYEYDGGPVILAVAPNSGPLAGGTQVVIGGTDLEGTGPVSVTFGGLAATNIITDPAGQLITATTPAHAAGTVDVAVAVLVGASVITTPVTAADQFTYGVPSTPTSTPTSVSTRTATATPARLGASATRVPASPCRRALPLHVRLSSRTVRSAGTVVIRARTVSRARLGVVVRVLARKTVVTGTGTRRRRVVRTIVLYRASATGRADARGRFQGKVHVTYKAAKQTRALLTVTTRAGCAATTATLRLTILPRRQHRGVPARGAVPGVHATLVDRHRWRDWLVWRPRARPGHDAVAGPAEPVACPVLDAGRRGRVRAHRLERLAIHQAQEEAAPPCAATRSL